GDGSIDLVSAGSGTANIASGSTCVFRGQSLGTRVGACRDAQNALHINASADNVAGADGSDYVEGGSGNDVILGNQGQDDLIGGSSDLFSLTDRSLRADGANLMFGGSGNADDRSTYGTDGTPQNHADDADVVVANNGDILRLVGVGGVGAAGFLSFNYDNYTDTLPAGQRARIVPRAVTLIDYTPGGPDYRSALAASDIGSASEIHGENGDDVIYGGPGADKLFGDAGNDMVIGGYGNNWIS